MLLRSPAWSDRWETRDLDELRAFIGRWGDHRRHCLGRGSFAFRLAIIHLAGGAIGWGEGIKAQKVRATTRSPLLHLSLTSPLSYRVGRRHLEAAPGGAVFIPAGSEYEVFYGAGRWLAVQFSGDELDTGCSPSPDLRRDATTKLPREMPLGTGARAELSAILRSATRSPFSSTEPAAFALEQTLTHWVADILNRKATRSKHSVAAESRLRRTEEWIDAHIDESIGLALLCRIAGIDARGLQASFRRRRGVTPMQWIQARRLTAARVRLLDNMPGDTVTKIALASGLTHAGRFALEYRRRYGESPSETLRRNPLQSPPPATRHDRTAAGRAPRRP